MKPKINDVIVLGEVIKVERRDTSRGGVISLISMAIDDSYVNKSGQVVARQFPLEVTYFKDFSARRGDILLIQGKLNINEWTTQGGRKASKLVVIATNAPQLIGSSSSGGGYGEGAEYTEEPTEEYSDDIPF